MTLQTARLWHLPKLLRILWAGTLGSGSVTRRRDEDVRALAKLVWRGQVLIAKDCGITRAFLARDGARIHALYTEPRWRGQGVGAQLLSAAQSAAGQLELWTAQANNGARRFYLAHGFREVRLTQGEGNDDGLPDVLMKWERPIT